MTPEEVENAVKWYEKERPTYEAVADRIYDLIFDILDSEKINFQNIESRAKELNSFKEKLDRNIVKDPKDMQDLVGVRIIWHSHPGNRLVTFLQEFLRVRILF